MPSNPALNPPCTARPPYLDRERLARSGVTPFLPITRSYRHLRESSDCGRDTAIPAAGESLVPRRVPALQSSPLAHPIEGRYNEPLR